MKNEGGVQYKELSTYMLIVEAICLPQLFAVHPYKSRFGQI